MCSISVVSSSYRFSGPFVVRFMGTGLVALGGLVLVLVILGAVLPGLGGAVSVPGLTLVVLAVLAGLLAGLALLRRAVVVRFDEAGYRVRFVRGTGVRQAEWKQVEDVATATVAGQRCVVLRLRDGRTTTVPVDALATRTEPFVDDLRTHLNRGHGYRRMPRRDR